MCLQTRIGKSIKAQKQVNYVLSYLCRKFRYLAYRQLVWWGWNHLGRYRRVVLPSCAVNKIRDVFPSDEYTGH